MYLIWLAWLSRLSYEMKGNLVVHHHSRSTPSPPPFLPYFWRDCPEWNLCEGSSWNDDGVGNCCRRSPGKRTGNSDARGYRCTRFCEVVYMINRHSFSAWTITLRLLRRVRRWHWFRCIIQFVESTNRPLQNDVNLLTVCCDDRGNLPQMAASKIVVFSTQNMSESSQFQSIQRIQRDGRCAHPYVISRNV